MDNTELLIGVVPTGTIGGQLMHDTLVEVRSILRKTLISSSSGIQKVQFRIIPSRPEPIPPAAYNKHTGKYIVDPFFNLAAKEKGKADNKLISLNKQPLSKVIVYTEMPLYSSDNWGGVCGEADQNGIFAVISLHMLIDKYAKPHDIKERLVKVSLHEIGHLLNLHHCDNKSCAMSSSIDYHDVDVIKKEYCNICQKRLHNMTGKHYRQWDGE